MINNVLISDKYITISAFNMYKISDLVEHAENDEIAIHIVDSIDGVGVDLYITIPTYILNETLGHTTIGRFDISISQFGTIKFKYHYFNRIHLWRYKKKDYVKKISGIDKIVLDDKVYHIKHSERIIVSNDRLTDHINKIDNNNIINDLNK